MRCIKNLGQIINRLTQQVDYSYLSNVRRVDPPFSEQEEELEAPRPKRRVSVYRLIVHTGSLIAYQLDYQAEGDALHAFETFSNAKSGMIRRVTMYKIFADSQRVSIMEHMRTRSVK